ncbi:MAG: helix-turn-helix transcriptional regulator [Treponema sp.]|nr:helix-turn-helix transcriptional regulator [Treponema sp.]
MTEHELRGILSRNIKRYRNNQNLSQADLAEKLDISVNFLCNIENGNRGISFETIAKFVSALNIEPYELFKTETSMPSNAPLIVNKCLDEAVAAVTEALSKVRSYYT